MTDHARDRTADVRILIADDHEVVRIGLASLLDRQPGFRVVGEARSGDEVVRLARQTRPDVVIMDIRMPDGSGID
ncbi:MAG: response regulator transcription factor, partial [Chloroflexi bacterium]|nr:response regulator transcription factor [Chloroflexota bacterium]